MASEPSENTKDPKPGYKTSEFWLTTLVTLTGLLTASGVIQSGSSWDKIVGLVVSALAAMGYSASRGSVKRK